MGERGQGGSFRSDLLAPIFGDLAFHNSFPRSFGGRTGKYFEGVKEMVLVAELPYLEKPRN